MDNIGLYVHWPYCARLCPYCDFNIYKAKGTDAGLLTAILADIRNARLHTGPRRLVSIHFGGGTPSLIPPADMARIIDTAAGLWTADPKIEIGLEANPNDALKGAVSNWQGAGINRVSIGVQSFDDTALRFLGRDHSGDNARQAIEAALELMPRVSCDLIFGLSGQSLHAWESDIETAIQSGVPHISAYQLTVKPGTAFARARMRGDDKAVSDDDSADFYGLARDRLLSAGFAHYEVSNYAKTPADRSRHNLLYWQGEDYVGAGPGAHGRITINGHRHAAVCAMNPKAYVQMVSQMGSGVAEREMLSPDDTANEYVLMGLRCADGISLSRFCVLSGHELNAAALDEHIALGHLIQNGERIHATETGYLLLDAISLALLS